MTMFTLPNFCRVCLKYDKNLIDLAHIENEPSETLMSKLQQCVSEVEWTVFKPLLCHPCIKRLNIAHSFKKQCVQSAGVLKNYVELVKESQKKNESQSAIKTENTVPTAGAYMLLPNQKYVKILVGSQNQGTNTFQNVFLNLIPTNALNSVITPTTESTNSIKTKDSNQNVFLNLNNTFQKLVPVSQAPKKVVEPLQKPTNLNVNQLLTESKSEELSVEIDPNVFGLEGDEDDSNEEEEANDYDEVISQAKITLKDFKSNGEKLQNGKEENKYVPILPKHQDDFFSSGQHFLFSSSENAGAFSCEVCQKPFETKKLLKAHINQFHLGKLPFKCKYCYLEYATRSEYDICIKTHKIESETLNKSITLQDFTNNSPSLNDLQLSELEAHIQPSENGDYICDVCRRPFSSSTGLLRHKVRKHNQKNKKKYFIKGMKNAKCDICNREFSTQSYMQLHKKLHMRDDIGYKYKVFGKSKYGELDIKDEKDENKKEKEKSDTDGDNSKVENLDVTPDILTEEEYRKSDDESNDEERDPSISTGNKGDEKMDVDEDENDTEEEDPEEEEEEDTDSKTNLRDDENCDVDEEKNEND